MDYSWENHAPLTSDCCSLQRGRKNYIGNTGDYIRSRIKTFSCSIVFWDVHFLFAKIARPEVEIFLPKFLLRPRD